MFVTPAFAQGSSLMGSDSLLVTMLPFVLIFVIMYFLILRPQQKRVKEHTELVKNLRRGDTVVTSGGLVGNRRRRAHPADASDGFGRAGEDRACEGRHEVSDAK
jgi:hypothetical protein